MEIVGDRFSKRTDCQAEKAKPANKKPPKCRKIISQITEKYLAKVPVFVNALIRADIAANEAQSFTADTVYSYIQALKKIFVIEETEVWNPNLRFKTAIDLPTPAILSIPQLP